MNASIGLKSKSPKGTPKGHFNDAKHFTKRKSDLEAKTDKKQYDQNANQLIEMNIKYGQFLQGVHTISIAHLGDPNKMAKLLVESNSKVSSFIFFFYFLL